MTDPPDRLARLGSTVGRALVLVPLVLVLLSVWLSPDSNWTARAGVAAFAAIAVASPASGLLITIALLGFGSILANMAGVPSLRVTEVLVVVSVAGYLLRAVPPGSPFRPALAGRVTAAVVLFGLAAVVSALVWLRVYQFETDYASTYALGVLRFLGRDWFLQRGHFSELVSTAMLLEGLALYVVAGALCRADATFKDRALRMLALGGAGIAVLSVVRLAEIVLRNPGTIDVLRASSAGLRISPQIPDYIAAGSYFALCWLVGLGIAIGSPGRRLFWVVAGVPLLGALYLTGSRSVIAAAFAGLAVLVFIVVRRRAAAGRGVVAFAVVAVIAMIATYSWLTGRDVAGEMAGQSLKIRVELARTSARVIATRPLFGVGIDRFHIPAGSLASPELSAMWQARKNPHNDFLRVGAELGLVGLALFLWIRAAGCRKVGRRIVQTRDARLAGLAAGLVAFFITSLVSDPLMVREVSYAFWIALGLAVGYSTPSPDSAQDPPAAVRWRGPAAILVAAALVLSIPMRARRELTGVDLTRVSYGLFEWGTDPDGTRCRWSGPRATFFADRRARLVEIPVSGTLPHGVAQQVEVRVDGRLANRVTVGPDWQRVRAFLPNHASTAPRRIDLQVSPTWVPAQTIPGNEDTRVLGVKVGEINVVMTPGQVR